jgi:hypothetical protein
LTTLYEAESEAHMTTPKKRHRDFSQAAKLVMDTATGQVEDRPPTPDAVEPEPTGMTKEPDDLFFPSMVTTPLPFCRPSAPDR